MQKINSVIRSALLAGTTVVATFGGIASAQAGNLPEAMEDKLVAVCQAIKDDSRIELHKAVRDSGVSYRRLARGLVCDGMDMYTFAMQHGADNTGAVIAKRTNLEEPSLTAKQ
ncbi:DUF3718 domain-containing protein [uncultured Alteromonas sp.]|jgi:hypothetical protein|uniref:DUF3718 domain-containing protein n=1 Tax=uncultured Alteromonas sp. TaxID=179113 RepID=UPI0025EB704F|nr:DUF3718 domain-containing protein [uncultured Alteromonas sp.]